MKQDDRMALINEIIGKLYLLDESYTPQYPASFIVNNCIAFMNSLHTLEDKIKLPSPLEIGVLADVR